MILGTATPGSIVGVIPKKIWMLWTFGKKDQADRLAIRLGLKFLKKYIYPQGLWKKIHALSN